MASSDTPKVLLLSDEYLAPATLAAEIHVPLKTLSQWRYRGEGPRLLKLGGHVRYRRSDIELWLVSRERGFD